MAERGVAEGTAGTSTTPAVATMTLLAAAVVAVAVAARLVPLLWSPLPATLDGLAYAGYARDAIATGAIPIRADDPFRADDFLFTGLLTVGSQLTGVAPRYLAQPLTAAVGGLGTLVGVAIVRRIGWRLRLPVGRLRLAVAVSGLGLAVSGIYARRTGVPDSELLGLVWLPIVAVAFVYAAGPGGRRWWLLVGLLLVAFPLAHTLGATVLLFVLAALAASAIASGSARRAAPAVAVSAGYWLYVGSYYALVEGVPGLFVPYADRVAGAPGLFLSWVLLAAVGLPWLVTTRRALRYGPLVVVGALEALLVANAVVPVFPGTIPTPPALLYVALPLLVPFAVAGLAAHRSRRTAEGRAMLALLVGAIALVGFALTAGLTPEYFDMVLRAQTFAHFPLLAFAGVAVALYGLSRSVSPPMAGSVPARTSVATRGRALRGLLLAGVVGALLLSAPLAYVNLDTMTDPSTTTPQGFHATAFASGYVPGAWASDGPNVRIHQYYARGGGGQITPVHRWVHGGDPPACPTLVQRRWLTRGASFYPAASQQLSASAHRTFTEREHVVYSASGLDQIVLVVPRDGTGEC